MDGNDRNCAQIHGFKSSVTSPLFILLLAAFTTMPVKAQEIVAVLSSNSGYYQEALEGFQEIWSQPFRVINLQKEKRVVESMINTILSRPANALLGYVPEIEVNIPSWTFEQLRSLALESRPEVRAMSLGIEMNKAELSASKREYFPDLMVRVMYKDMAMTKNDFWSTMLGISIPIAPWTSSKVVSKVDENELNVKKAEEEYSNMKNMTLFEVQDALVKVQTNKNIVLLYKNTTIPQAEQTLQSTIAAYQTGKTEFLMLIDAYRMLLMTRLDYYMAVMNYMASQAQLEQAVGLEIAEITRIVQ